MAAFNLGPAEVRIGGRPVVEAAAATYGDYLMVLIAQARSAAQPAGMALQDGGVTLLRLHARDEVSRDATA